ncbi:uncharacterized protein LOC113346222 [Papaver somniferum]|uniref:uncharacterized protein LOC113346222 n=1 Tax=Papaver somniferum TaxID=3469 RepID=UPI000E7018DB|nr:uncharacterized protein LOC113346222 [Papaver somniferum]
MPITVANKPVLGNFLLLDCRAPYNEIVGRDWMHAIGAVTSSYHQCLKFVTSEGVVKSPLPPESYVGEDAVDPPTVEKLVEVHIGDEEHKSTFVRADLPAHECEGLITLLRANVDVFAWSFAEMYGIDPNVACHRLNIDEKFHLVRQKVRNMVQSKKYGVVVEIEKLLEAGFIRPVQYPRWLSNVVPVPQKNGKIRVCINFTDLNKSCLSDPYPLPRIRVLVDATSGYGRLSFMDGFSGYNQIPLFEEDQEHTAFVTDKGVYCYTVMPFGLKNAGTTYQHLVDDMFRDLIGKTMEVYIDDMVVKSKQKESHFIDLQKMFDILRGIEANPEQIRAIRDMPSPRTKKEFQKLAGRLTTLSHFILRSSNRFKPFFDVLRKAVNFGWTEECKRSFDEIKLYLSTPPVLVSSKTGQPVGVYLAATENAVSAILFVTEEHEKPVYFVSKSLTGAEIRTAEKGHALTTLLADFPVDDIEIVTEEEELLNKPEDSTTNRTGGESTIEVDTPEPLWTVFTNGSSKVSGSGVGCIIITPEGSRIEKATRLEFHASNNEAEYEAAIVGLKTVKQLDAKNVKLVTDSMLVVNHDHGWKHRHADALAYLSSVVDTDTTRFVVVDFQELPSISDSHFVLALEHASGGEKVTTSVQEDIGNTDNNMDVDIPEGDDSGNPTKNDSDWRQSYIRYLTASKLPEDEHLTSKAEEGQQILAEAHEGICGNHSGGRSIAHMILTQGNFWPYMQKDAKEYAQKCVPCQEHAPIPKRPANELRPVLSPWPFAKWGLDVVGPLPKVPGGVKLVLDATDYFTKWVEEVALIRNPTRVSVRQWQAVRLWSDQRILQEFEQSPQLLCSLLCSEQRAGEATNRVIMENLKKRLEKAKGKWTEEFPGVLWSYRTTPKRSTVFSPFTLTYGTEAVIPTEIHLKTTKTRAVKAGNNNSIMDLDKELLEEQRETALQ